MVARYYADHIDALRWAFDTYSAMASDQGKPDNRFTVNLAEFCQLLVDTGLLRADITNTHSAGQNNDSELSLTVRSQARVSLATNRWRGSLTRVGRLSAAVQAAREIFAGVQRDEAGPFVKASVENPMQELVLSEFLEAIARCGTRQPHPRVAWSCGRPVGWCCRVPDDNATLCGAGVGTSSLRTRSRRWRSESRRRSTRWWPLRRPSCKQSRRSKVRAARRRVGLRPPASV